ncbi:trichohyalin-like isoform X1 [Solanum pennellii]|uniref:Trichohyalin-like isoform X1 n=1 Tax=Solanum pennellii TaxID=28526 RepID=A0ABM1GZE7_SOLPN|nr:trichohyalin-like isoform X1 [Solanum pennellii]
MDDSDDSRYKGLISTVRKKRSQTLRRPRTKNLTVPVYHVHSSQTLLSDSVDSASRDEYTDDTNAGGRIYNLNYSISRDSSAYRFKGDYSSKKNKGDGGSSATYDNACAGDDTNPRHGASVRKLGNAGDNVANDSKLKIGGAAGIIQTKKSSYGSSGSSLSSKSGQPSDASQPKHNLTPQDNSSEYGPLADKKSRSKGIACKGFPGGTFGASKSNMKKMPMKNVFKKPGDKPHKNRKVHRRRRLILDDLDEEDEIHYLEERNVGEELTKTRSLSGGLKVDKYEMLEDAGRSDKEVKRISNQGSEDPDYEEEELLFDGEAKRTKKKDKQMESYETPVETKSEISLTTCPQQQALLSGKEVNRKSNRGSEDPDYEEEELLSDGDAKRTKNKEKQMKESYETSVETKSEISLTTSPRQQALLSGKEVNRKSNRGSEDPDYEEEELLSDGEAERTKKKESIETSVETKSEIRLTTRQRALLSRRDSSATSVNQIEYPYGCPPAPSQKQKEKFSDVEQQLKRAKAAQKRRIRYEEAARESEAEAIRKIRGQDSNKKKREKIKKQQEELAQEKAANELAPNTIRTVMGPTGTVVTFSHDLGLPSIFDSKPCSYPPPPEKCAGPSCVNPSKYRDPKSNLRLCSLECYKAIHEKMKD